MLYAKNLKAKREKFLAMKQDEEKREMERLEGRVDQALSEKYVEEGKVTVNLQDFRLPIIKQSLSAYSAAGWGVAVLDGRDDDSYWVEFT